MMDPRSGYGAHGGLDNGGNPYLHQNQPGGGGYAAGYVNGPNYGSESMNRAAPPGYNPHQGYGMPQGYESDKAGYEHRYEVSPPHHSDMNGPYSGTMPYGMEGRMSGAESRTSSTSSFGSDMEHRSRGAIDRAGGRASNYGSNHGRREERGERSGARGDANERGSRRKGGRGGQNSGNATPHGELKEVRRGGGEAETRGKKKRRDIVSYAVYLRCYALKRVYLDMIDLKKLHPSMSCPVELNGVKIHWPETIPISTLSTTLPSIPINFSVPMSINNEIVPPTWSSKPPTRPLAGTNRTQVRVLLIRGSPIDISAPKSGSVHSNNNITFLLLEKVREGKLLSISAPGGVFDPKLDDRESKTLPQHPNDPALIRTAIRTVKEQLNLDLTACSKWYRFLDVEYSRDATSTDDRIVYFIPSVWELLPTEQDFPALWHEHHKIELQSEALMQIARLKNRLSVTQEGSPQYDEIQLEITRREDETRYFTEPPQNAPIPPKPMLLIRVNPDATNGQRATSYTLQNMLDLDVRGETTLEEVSELFLVAHRFDEYLQCFFGTSIFVHAAMMRDYVLRGQRPLNLEGVPLTVHLPDPKSKKRSWDEQTPVSPTHLPEQQTFEAQATQPVKREIKLENPTSTDSPSTTAPVGSSIIKPDPGCATSDFQAAGDTCHPSTLDPRQYHPSYQDADSSHHQNHASQNTGPQNASSHQNSSSLQNASPNPPASNPVHTPNSATGTSPNAPLPRELGVPLDSQRARPPLVPEFRDYRLMQAFRYFDLHRLGFLQGDDLVNIFLSLGLGINRKIAVELSAAADVSLPHYPFIHSGFEGDKHVRYKPACDWLSSMGFALPTGED